MKGNRSEMLSSCIIKTPDGNRRVEKYLDFAFDLNKYGRFTLTYIANRMDCNGRDEMLYLNVYFLGSDKLELYGCKNIIQENGGVEKIVNNLFLKMVMNSTVNHTEMIDRNISTEDLKVSDKMQKICLDIEKKIKVCQNDADKLRSLQYLCLVFISLCFLM